MTLRVFLPRLALDYLQRRPERPIGIPEYARGTCLFADVSGFTALSESLAAMGREGAEVLTRVLNGFYAEVISVLKPAGGDVIRFAGDAVTVFFPGVEREANAVEAALALQAMMGKFDRIPTPVGESCLKMKIGLASGECVFFLVGGGEGLDYVFAGRPVDRCAEAEHHAAAGEIIFAGNEFSAQSSKFKIEEIAQGFHRIVGLQPSAFSPRSFPQPSAFSLQSSSAAEEASLAPFLHPRILELQRGGGLDLVNEHRAAVVAFIQAGRTLDCGREEDLVLLGRFYAAAADLARRFDGSVNKIDCGDKGNKLLVLFGAPVAHEDDADRALEFALALQKGSRKLGLPLRIGINRARVFCGLVGSPERHEYTVMGDGVNVAARLMQAAPDDAVLAAEGLKETASSGFYFQDLPPMQFKGKSRPMPVAKLQGRTGETFQIPFFIGRDAERAALLEALRNHPGDRPFLAWVEGEPGVGKSYFLHHFSEQCLPPEHRCYSRCQSYASSMAYFPFQKFLQEVLQAMKVAQTFTPREKVLVALAQRDPEMRAYAPLLLRALNLAAPEDREPDLEPEIRRSLLWKMMLLLLQEALRQREIVWIIDNAQWMDEESRAFLAHLLRMLESGRLRVFAASRDPAPDEPGLAVHRVPLGPFSEEEAGAYARALLGVREAPEEALRKAWAVGRGNPLLHQESLRLMLKSGYLSRSEDFPDILMIDASAGADLPESLSGIVLSQVDALPAAEKGALMRLSVAGENIPEPLARALGVEKEVIGRLAAAGQFLRYNAVSQNYFFAKQAYQQAVYDSLEFSFRREAHLKLAEAVEAAYDITRPDTAFLLAHHFGEAASPRAIPFLERIGREAKEAYALQEAAKAYARLVAIGREAGMHIQRAQVELAELYLLLGNAEAAGKLMEGNLEAFGPECRSAAHRTLAGAFRAQGAFPQAETHAKKALETAAQPHDAFGAECFLGKLYGQTGRMEQALKTMERIETDHKHFKNDPEYQMNRMRLAFVRFQTGQAGQAQKMFEAISGWFNRKGQIKGQYAILNNLSLIKMERGEYVQALRYCEDAYRVVNKYGFWEAESVVSVLFNRSLLNLYLGNLIAAYDIGATAHTYAKRYGTHLLYKTEYLLLLNHLQRGQYAAALQYLDAALATCRQHKIPANEVIETAMDLYWELAAPAEHSQALDLYAKEIKRLGLSYLHEALKNYQAENSLLRSDSSSFVVTQEDHIKVCLGAGLLPEAYRAARSLFLATLDHRFLVRMAEILSKLDLRQFHVELACLQYADHPTPERRTALIALLRRYPYGLLSVQAYAAMAQAAKSGRTRKKYLIMAKEKMEKMAEGLPEDLKASFLARPEFKHLREAPDPALGT